jgi:hypothetical protein
VRYEKFLNIIQMNFMFLKGLIKADFAKVIALVRVSKDVEGSWFYITLAATNDW